MSAAHLSPLFLFFSSLIFRAHGLPSVDLKDIDYQGTLSAVLWRAGGGHAGAELHGVLRYGISRPVAAGQGLPQRQLPDAPSIRRCRVIHIPGLGTASCAYSRPAALCKQPSRPACTTLQSWAVHPASLRLWACMSCNVAVMAAVSSHQASWAPTHGLVSPFAHSRLCKGACAGNARRIRRQLRHGRGPWYGRLRRGAPGRAAPAAPGPGPGQRHRWRLLQRRLRRPHGAPFCLRS